MNIKPIKTENDYNKALKRIEEIWDAKINTKEGDELEILAILVEAYEEKHYPISEPDPVEAIKFRLDQMGLTQKDLAKLIGSNRASEVLNKKRNLSVSMIKVIHEKLNLPVELLIK